MSAARPANAMDLGNDLADQHDAELQLADLDDQRLVPEVRRVDRERRVLRRGWIDAPHRRMLAAEGLPRQLDRAVMIDRGGILVDGRRREQEEVAERRDAEMVVV